MIVVSLTLATGASTFVAHANFRTVVLGNEPKSLSKPGADKQSTTKVGTND